MLKILFEKEKTIFFQKVWLRKLRSKRFDDSFLSFLKTANSDGQTLSMKNFINCQKVLEDEGVIIVENDPNPNMVSLSDLTVRDFFM